MLVIGAALFIAVGCLVMTTVDSVPSNLVVNALVLGTLSIVTGMVFVLDTCLSNRRNDKKSPLSKNTRYGDIARTRVAADMVDSARTTNGVHANGGGYMNGGVHVDGGEQVNGVVHTNGDESVNRGHDNGGILKWETVEKKQNGLLQTTAANGRVVGSGQDAYADDDMAPVVHHQYGRKNMDNRGFDGHRYADWYDTEMDLSKMKKLEINVPTDDALNNRNRYTQ